MDANKLEVLKAVGYQVGPACGLCVHGRFAPGQDFGTCALHTYRHLKHSGPGRELSVNRLGHCPDFEMSEARLVTLGRFRELT